MGTGLPPLTAGLNFHICDAGEGGFVEPWHRLEDTAAGDAPFRVDQQLQQHRALDALVVRRPRVPRPLDLEHLRRRVIVGDGVGPARLRRRRGRIPLPRRRPPLRRRCPRERRTGLRDEAEATQARPEPGCRGVDDRDPDLEGPLKIDLRPTHLAPVLVPLAYLGHELAVVPLQTEVRRATPQAHARPGEPPHGPPVVSCLEERMADARAVGPGDRGLQTHVVALVLPQEEASPAVGAPRLAGRGCGGLRKLVYGHPGHEITGDVLHHPGGRGLSQLDAQVVRAEGHADLDPIVVCGDVALPERIDEHAPRHRAGVGFRPARGRRARRRQGSPVQPRERTGGGFSDDRALVLLRDPLELADRLPEVTLVDATSHPQVPEAARSRLPYVLVPVVERAEEVVVAHLFHLEVHRHRHDDRHGHAVEQRGRVSPLRHGLDGGVGQRRHAPQRLRVGHLAVGIDGALEDDDARQPGAPGVRGVLGSDGPDLQGLLDLAGDLHRPGRQIRQRRLAGEPEDDQGEEGPESQPVASPTPGAPKLHDAPPPDREADAAGRYPPRVDRPRARRAPATADGRGSCAPILLDSPGIRQAGSRGRRRPR